MGQFSAMHWLLLLVIVLLFFGPSRLPGLGKSIGKTIRGFKEGMREANLEDEEETISKKEALPQATVRGETISANSGSPEISKVEPPKS